jgi:nucleotide-binding universal stress UspA family protein
MSGLHPTTTVVPIDFSELSFTALDRAIEIAGDNAVHVIHVLVELATMEPGNLYGTVTDESRIKSVKEHLHKRLSDDKYAGVIVHAAVGDPGREITALAEREGADLIVMPSHGYGFFKHMLLGSVAERVVRLAHCAVLVLRS